jgi:hypothetical protein
MFVRKSLRQAALVLAATAVLITACSGGAAPTPTVDVNAIGTAAVETAMGILSSQFTQTALAAPSATPMTTNTALPLPTFALPTGADGTPVATGALPTVSFNSTATTPLAGFTPLASPQAPAGPTTSLGDACNNSIYIADVTYPDNTEVKPGTDFEKVWRIQNTGSCTWDEGYKLAFIGGDTQLDPYTFEFERSEDFVAGGATADLGIDLTAPLAEGTYTATWRMQSDSGAYFGTPLTVVIVVKK